MVCIIFLANTIHIISIKPSSEARMRQGKVTDLGKEKEEEEENERLRRGTMKDDNGRE